MMDGGHLAYCAGQKIRYKVAGEGPPLVVQAPGWGIGAGLYEHTLAPLESRFTVIYYDPRGSGGSMPAATASENVGSFVDDLEALREHLGLPSFALFGHSHGGFIAMNYALAYGQRVSHLILADAQLGVNEPAQDVQRNLPRLAQDPRFARAAEIFGSPRQLTSDDELKTLLEGIWPLYFANPAGDAAISTGRLLRDMRPAVAAMLVSSASNAKYLVRERLGDICIPTLVMVGRHDFICSPVQAEIIQRGIDGATLEIFEHSGHFPWLEEPERFFAMMNRVAA